MKSMCRIFQLTYFFYVEVDGVSSVKMQVDQVGRI